MPEEQTRGVSAYGVAAMVFGVIGVAAAVLAAIVWSGHRSEVAERVHQTEVLQAAADWTALLINLNSDTAAQNLQQLRDGTIGALNVEFDKTVEPFTGLVAKLDAKTVGQVESVSIEALQHSPGDTPDTPAPEQPELATVAARTDTVLVVATSVSQNAGAEPTTVRWNLRLDVSDVDGKLLVSQLESIR